MTNSGESSVTEGRRFFTALVAANTVYNAIAWTYTSYQAFQQHKGHYFVFFDNFVQALGLWVPVEVIMMIAILVIAYPVEAWLGKRGAYFPVFGYLVVFGGLLLISGLLALPLGGPTTGIWGLFVIIGLFGGIVAIPARLLYPTLLRFKTATKALAAVQIAVAALAVGYLQIPHQSAWAATKYDLFNNRTDGELARETFLNGAPAEIQQMQRYEPKLKTVAGQKYDLVIKCEQAGVEATFVATVSNAQTGEAIKSLTLVCPKVPANSSGGASTVVPIDFGNKSVDPKLSLKLLNTKPNAHLPQAFAAVVKSGLPW